jgi:hypothetical protein
MGSVRKAPRCLGIFLDRWHTAPECESRTASRANEGSRPPTGTDSDCSSLPHLARCPAADTPPRWSPCTYRLTCSTRRSALRTIGRCSWPGYLPPA